MISFRHTLAVCLLAGTFVWGLAAQDSSVAGTAEPGVLYTSAAPASTGADALEPSLVAVGTLGAANVYYSYLTIGSCADSFVAGTYDAPLAAAIANEVKFLNQGTIDSLRTMLIANGLTKEDKDALSYLIETYEILNRQASSLITFMTDRNDQGMAYQDYRAEAWNRIKQMFGK